MCFDVFGAPWYSDDGHGPEYWEQLLRVCQATQPEAGDQGADEMEGQASGEGALCERIEAHFYPAVQLQIAISYVGLQRTPTAACGSHTAGGSTAVIQRAFDRTSPGV